MAAPKISVLITTSTGKWLNTCLASVLRQRLQDFELIIGSSSHSEEIENTLSRWRDPRIQIFRAAEPIGTAQMRQQLLSLARGKFVKLLQDRDFLYENSLDELSKAIEATGALVAFHNWRIVDEQGIPLDRSNSVPTGYTEVSSELLTRYVVARRDNLIGGGTNMLFDREIAIRLPTLFGVDKFDLAQLGELAMCIHLSFTKSIVGVGVLGAAIRKLHTGSNNSIGDSSSQEQLEWEILQRWCLDQGHIQKSEVPKMVRTTGESDRSDVTDLLDEGPLLNERFKETIARQLNLVTQS